MDTTSSKKPNPTFAGSNRFYRGKIIEELRDHLDPIEINKLGYLIKPDYSPRTDKIWLESLINTLVKDGLIEKEKGMASLP